MEKTTVLGIVIAVLILIIYGIYYSVTTSPTDTSPTDTCSPTNLTGTCTSPMTCVQSGTNAGTCQNSYTCSSSSLTGTCPANQSCTNGKCGPAPPVAANCAFSYNQGPYNPTPANIAATCNSAYPACNGYQYDKNYGVCGSYTCSSSSLTGTCPANQSCTNGVCGPATPVASCAFSFNQGPSNPTPANIAATCNSTYQYCNGYINGVYWGVCGSTDTEDATTCNSDSDCNNDNYTTGSCSNNKCVYSGCAGDYMGNCTTTDPTCFTDAPTPQDPTSGPNCCWSGLSSAHSCCAYAANGCDTITNNI